MSWRDTEIETAHLEQRSLFQEFVFVLESRLQEVNEIAIVCQYALCIFISMHLLFCRKIPFGHRAFKHFKSV